MSEDEAIEADESFPAAPEAGPDDVPGVLPEVAFVVPEPAVFEASATTDDSLDIGPAPAPAGAREFEALGEGLHRKLDDLRTLFDREIRAEATREKVVDRLHAELQEYKQGLIQGILRPIFVDLIQLHDDIGKMADASASEDSPPEVRRLLGLIRGYQQGIEDILYRQGVEPFTEEGDAFDPRRQRALSSVPTDDPALNKRVSARLRKGFRSADKVIRPEMVTVYAFKATNAG